MSKAYTDLDMNSKDITGALNETAETVRSNTQFNRNGGNGITSSFSVNQTDLTNHAFVFNGGILTDYTLTGGH